MDEMTKLDSITRGSVQTFQSGAIRSSKEGKGRFDLMPVNAVVALAQLFEKGAKEYGERNWEKGIPQSSFMDSGIRHAFKALRGDSDEEHLINAAWNFLCAYELKVRQGQQQQKEDNRHE